MASIERYTGAQAARPSSLRTRQTASIVGSIARALSFKSAEQRRYFLSPLLSVIPHGLISRAAVYLGKPYDPVFTFFAVLVGIWLLEAAIWLRNIIWSWLMFGLWG